MAESLAFNMDCMEAMKRFPDKYFDLAVVDPPYGDGCSYPVQVERERERGGTASAVISTSTNRSLTQQLPTAREKEVVRTGGTWAAKYSKKLFRGMLRRGKTILRSCFASHVIR